MEGATNQSCGVTAHMFFKWLYNNHSNKPSNLNISLFGEFHLKFLTPVSLDPHDL